MFLSSTLQGFAVSDKNMIALGVVAMSCGAAVVTVWLVLAARDRRRRLELLEQALRAPGLLPEVQRDLVRALQPKQSRVPFTMGWFGLFFGITWLCFEPYGSALVAAVAVTVGSFAVMTLPFALRELDARRA